MKKAATPFILALLLWATECALILGRSNELSIVGALLLLGLTGLFVWFFKNCPQDDAIAAHERAADPWARLTQNRSTILKGLCLIATAVLLFFADVAFLGDSMVSAPWFNIGKDALPPSAGFGHTVDPWAGFLIEGPGIFMTGAAFATGEVPFWNPFEACGTPYAANGEMAVFSLLQLPLHLFPSLTAWDCFQLLRILLVGFGAWLCSFALGNSSRASLIPGFGMAFGGVFVLFSNLVHLNTALFVPWVILATECYLARTSIRRWSMLALTIALALNGGNPQPLACCLVLYSPVVLMRGLRNWKSILGYGLAALAAGALAAFSLLPLADLLSRSENRTYFLLEITGTASHVIDWFAPGGPLLGEAKEGVSGPPWWRIGSIPCFLALLSFKEKSRRNTGIQIGLLVYLALALFPSLAAQFHALPIIGGLKWTKYASGAQFLVLFLAALGFDRIRKEQRGTFCVLPLIIVLAVVFHGAYFRNRFDDQCWTALIVVGSVASLIALSRRHRWVLLLLPALFLVESSYYRPSYPKRLADLGAPEGLPQGTNIRATEWVPMAQRTMGYRDAVAPLLSGLQGWYDIRSVGAFPLTNYHKMMAPYMNCGPWPPYMLLGASREIILSPYLDLTGVHDVIFREGDFKDMVRERREDLLETNQFVRFGEFQRALDYATITTSNLVAPNAFDGSFVLLPSEPFSLNLNLFAKSARIGFRCESPTKKSFVVDAEIDGVTHRFNSGEPHEFEIKDATQPTSWRMSLDSEDPVRFVLTEWWVDRHITKGKNDFVPNPTAKSAADDLVILRNKYPLAIARVVYQGEYVPESELRDKLQQFVSTGVGWDHRSEVLITPTPTMAIEALPPFITKQRETAAILQRQGWNQMKVECDSASAGWLSIAVSFDPGWSATVNGQEAPIVLANGAFMAVPLETEGHHEVEFSYEAPNFQLGLWISGITALLLLALNAWSRRQGLRRTNSSL